MTQRANDAPLTRSEAIASIEAAAKKYNPSIAASDFVVNEGGALQKGSQIAKPELFMMLAKAFPLESPAKGNNKWIGDFTTTYEDAHDWAKEATPKFYCLFSIL